MVTQKERVYLSIKDAVRIVNESNGKKEMVERIKSLERRMPAQPPPKGGVGIRAIARKYKMRHTTIVRWVKKGYIPVLLETKNEKYIDESIAIEIITKFKHYMGTGRKTIKKVLSGDTQCPAS